jgi:hypothetical protein
MYVKLVLLYRYITQTEYNNVFNLFWTNPVHKKTHKTCRALTYLSKL